VAGRAVWRGVVRGRTHPPLANPWATRKPTSTGPSPLMLLDGPSSLIWPLRDGKERLSCRNQARSVQKMSSPYRNRQGGASGAIFSPERAGFGTNEARSSPFRIGNLSVRLRLPAHSEGLQVRGVSPARLGWPGKPTRACARPRPPGQGRRGSGSPLLRRCPG
jgi:hypothetical protein